MVNSEMGCIEERFHKQNSETSDLPLPPFEIAFLPGHLQDLQTVYMTCKWDCQLHKVVNPMISPKVKLYARTPKWYVVRPGRHVFLGVSTTFIDNYSSPHDGGDFCGPRI